MSRRPLENGEGMDASTSTRGRLVDWLSLEGWKEPVPNEERRDCVQSSSSTASTNSESLGGSVAARGVGVVGDSDRLSTET